MFGRSFEEPPFGRRFRARNRRQGAPAESARHVAEESIAVRRVAESSGTADFHRSGRDVDRRGTRLRADDDGDEGGRRNAESTFRFGDQSADRGDEGSRRVAGSARADEVEYRRDGVGRPCLPGTYEEAGGGDFVERRRARTRGPVLHEGGRRGPSGRRGDFDDDGAVDAVAGRENRAAQERRVSGADVEHAPCVAIQASAEAEAHRVFRSGRHRDRAQRGPSPRERCVAVVDRDVVDPSPGFVADGPTGKNVGEPKKRLTPRGVVDHDLDVDPSEMRLGNRHAQARAFDGLSRDGGRGEYDGDEEAGKRREVHGRCP